MQQVLVPTIKSLYIELFFGETLLSSATATLVSNTQESHCTLVTNRHIVTGRHQETGECLSKQAAIPDSIIIYFHESLETLGDSWKKVKLPLYKEDGSPWWIEHPKLGSQADIVALNLKWGSDIVKYPYYLETNLDRVNLVIGPSETVSVIGFPFGLSTHGKLPIWATGFLAQELTLVTAENPKFLIDCRARQGQSGSPVIAYRAGGYRATEGDSIVSTVTGNPAWEFLGIYSGRINAESDLGIVWHTSAVKDLLQAATLEMERIVNEKKDD